MWRDKNILYLKQLCDKIRQLCVLNFFRYAEDVNAAVYEQICLSCFAVFEQLCEESEKETARLCSHSRDMVKRYKQGRTDISFEERVMSKQRQLSKKACLDDMVRKAYFAERWVYQQQETEPDYVDEDLPEVLAECESGKNPYAAIQEVSRKFIFQPALQSENISVVLEQIVQVLEQDCPPAELKNKAEKILDSYWLSADATKL